MWRLALPLSGHYKAITGRLKVVQRVGCSTLTRPVLTLPVRQSGRSNARKFRNNFTRRFAMQTENAVEIAKLNDAFRRSGFGITVTPGVQVLEDLSGLIDEVRRFNEFTEDNDP